MNTILKSKTFSFRMSPKIRSKLEIYAKKEDRPVAYLVNGVLERFLELEDEKIKIMRARAKDMEKGNIIPGEVVMSALRKWAKSKSNKPFRLQDYK